VPSLLLLLFDFFRRGKYIHYRRQENEKDVDDVRVGGGVGIVD